jgi:hypothetical protein
MRQILACLLVLALLGPLASPPLHANGLPGDFVPVREKTMDRLLDEIPLYSVAAGVAAVAMTGSLVALRIIRKRDGD